MGEITLLIQKIHTDKNAFAQLINKMTPLIEKYTRLLYKDEKEDVRSEMMLVLWESVTKISYCEKDGECLAYLSKALRNRFYDLYRKSRKQHDHQLLTENDSVFDIIRDENSKDLEDAIFSIDIEAFLKRYIGKKREIFETIIFGNKSDTEIAEIFSVTRQYVNRLRRELRTSYFLKEVILNLVLLKNSLQFQQEVFFIHKKEKGQVMCYEWERTVGKRNCCACRGMDW